MHRWTISLIAAVMIAAIPGSVVTAATTAPKPANNSGQGLEISPPVLELNANPGQTVTATIRVRNVAAGQLIAKGRADDFGAGDNEDGQPRLLLDEQGSSRYSLKSWISAVPDLRLAPQELKTAVVNIRVPANAEPGGHFGVIRFTAVPPELEGTGVSLSASVGTLVLLRVSGAIKNDVTLEEFSSARVSTGTKTEQQGQLTTKQSFFEQSPVGLLVRLRNRGTVHEKVQGSVTITDTFGNNVATVPVNEKGGNVLPESVRRFEQVLDKKALKDKGLFGRYTAKLSLTYLGGQKSLNATTTFWVIPWTIILGVLLGLIVLFFALKFGLRRYNEHIIKQARRR